MDKETKNGAYDGGIFPVGKENVDYNRYFTGTSYLCPLSTQQVYIANVTFEQHAI